MVIEYSEEALPDLKRLEGEGKLFLETSKIEIIAAADSNRNISRDGIIRAKKLPRPASEYIGAISNETAEDWLKQIKEMWD